MVSSATHTQLAAHREMTTLPVPGKSQGHKFSLVNQGGRRGAGWMGLIREREAYYHPAGGRDHPVKRSRHPAHEHGVSGGGGNSGTGGVVSRLISRSSEGQLVIDRAASPDTWPSGGRPSAPDPPDERYTPVHLNSQACRADGPPGGYFPEGHGDVQTRQDPAAGSHYTVCANIFISDKNSRNTGRSLVRIPYTWARSRS